MSFKSFNLSEIIKSLKPSCVTMLVGAPLCGKTDLAVDIAVQYGMFEGKTVALCSCEYGKRGLISKISKVLSEVDRRAKKLTAEDSERVKTAKASLRRSNMVIVDPDLSVPLTPQYFSEQIDCIVKKRGRIDLLVIDYITLMTPTKQSSSWIEELSVILNELGALAKKFDVPVLAVFRLFRSDYEYGQSVHEITGDATVDMLGFNGQWLLLRSDYVNVRYDISIKQGKDIVKIIPLEYDTGTGRFSERDNAYRGITSYDKP